MSFSSQVKEELISIRKTKKCCACAELAALLKNLGQVGFSIKGEPYLYIATENRPAANRVFTLIKKSYNIYSDIKVRKNSIFYKDMAYILCINDHDAVVRILKDTAVLGEENGFSAPEDIEKLITKECCKRSYLRGLFISCGTVTDPLKSYHLELDLPDEESVKQARECMLYFNINSKVSLRKGVYVVYIKDAEAISDMLSVLGAHKSLMEFENARIVKDVRNSINRKVNCETANIGKTVEAFEKQKADIEYLQSTGQFEPLSDKLKEVAYKRLEYPESSLEQLGELLTPKVGKSGVNHRLRRLSEIADNLRDMEKENRFKEKT